MRRPIASSSGKGNRNFSRDLAVSTNLQFLIEVLLRLCSSAFTLRDAWRQVTDPRLQMADRRPKFSLNVRRRRSLWIILGQGEAVEIEQHQSCDTCHQHPVAVFSLFSIHACFLSRSLRMKSRAGGEENHRPRPTSRAEPVRRYGQLVTQRMSRVEGTPLHDFAGGRKRRFVRTMRFADWSHCAR